MTNRDLQKARIRRYFIEAARQIIERDGIQGVTIRKVADIAGYNSATLYNYFPDLSHLIFFAAMTFVKQYTDDLPHYIAQANNALDEYLLIWECFCKHSFSQPEIYHALFEANLGPLPEDMVNSYYRLWPEDLENVPKELLPMVLESNLSKRAEISLKKCVDEGFVKAELVPEVNELVVTIYRGMFSLFFNNRTKYTVAEATAKTCQYIRAVIVRSAELFSRPSIVPMGWPPSQA
ncbi:MAG: TetR/AcrR family transcriptional regulator [Firmicutes bacterium]|nr:TetR/AcrR family transcriptional regulator [Bacillota bacterium]